MDYLRLNRYGGSATIPARERGHTEVIEKLIKKDFPIYHVYNLTWIALMEAIILGSDGATHKNIVELLIAAGLNVNIPDKDGIAPLQHAKLKGFKQIAEMLENAGAK